MEKRDLVDQRAVARSERTEAHLLAHPAELASFLLAFSTERLLSLLDELQGL